MQLIKIIFAFLAVGGSSYAIFKISQEAEPWVKVVSLIMAIAALLVALPYLPQAVDGVTEGAKRVYALLPDHTTVPAVSPLTSPPYSAPPSGNNITTFVPVPQPPQPPAIRVAALVMTNRGAWGSTHGGSTCGIEVQRARDQCSAHSNGAICGASSCDRWVAGIACMLQGPRGRRGNAFAGGGVSEHAAFQIAFGYAASQGFPSAYCHRVVAVSGDAGVRRY